MNLGLAEITTEVDNFNTNEINLVERSGVKFEYSKDGNYNGKIMEFINYIINLPEKVVETI